MRLALRPQFSSIARQAPLRRSLATSSFARASTRPSSKILQNRSLNNGFHQGYSEIKPIETKIPVEPIVPVKKPRKFRVFRWLWRLTYLSAIGGVAYMVYGVYELRHPDDQFESDPSKQNLVILGTNASSESLGYG